MSLVTNMILTCSVSENLDPEDTDYPCAIAEIQRWLQRHRYGELTDVAPYAGGTKALETAVFLGAFNYLRLGDFLAAVQAAPWSYYDSVQVFVQEQNDTLYREYALFPEQSDVT
jgi:hypothetical protein